MPRVIEIGVRAPGWAGRHDSGQRIHQLPTLIIVHQSGEGRGWIHGDRGLAGGICGCREGDKSRASGTVRPHAGGDAVGPGNDGIIACPGGSRIIPAQGDFEREFVVRNIDRGTLQVAHHIGNHGMDGRSVRVEGGQFQEHSHIAGGGGIVADGDRQGMHSCGECWHGHDDLYIAGGASWQGTRDPQWDGEAKFGVCGIGGKRSVGVGYAIRNVHRRDEHPVQIDETAIVTDHPD